MTNGKTTLKFSHRPLHALQASIDALTLAVAWSPEGELRGEMTERLADLQDLYRRTRQVKTFRLPR